MAMSKVGIEKMAPTQEMRGKRVCSIFNKKEKRSLCYTTLTGVTNTHVVGIHPVKCITVRDIVKVVGPMELLSQLWLSGTVRNKCRGVKEKRELLIRVEKKGINQ